VYDKGKTMQPTIRESLKNALEALKSSGFPPGGAVYDDLNQVLLDLGNEDMYGTLLEDQLTA
jgi:hypothetical protein